MHLLSILTLASALVRPVLGAGSATPAPPGVQYLFSANVTVGLSVDVGAIPAGNVTVIPVIGGAVLGPNIAGKMLALGEDWNIQTSNGYALSDTRAHIRAMDNSNIYVQMSGITREANGNVFVRASFQTGSKGFWWMNYVFAFGIMKPSATGFTLDMWYMSY
ncbi:hypothetical protein B0T26DRAFT_648720 [Lasiosphaeria miniovina]|uniref:Uncharacterized protein n=1 Tax=Lasiosphaeria miniovina TaxID=1954250 RepID=A0AA40DVZ1_9PEZI|nr:uncharacterized protein B0T26DRAFT_648720 [Lasiosphaeria miniovina]KAK0713718.1 hypothetical protein B0T26DRAFT_648720 [Lasiosphaeria miniovina]